MTDLKSLANRLRSNKGWLTQSINNLERLIGMTSSASNAGFLASKIEQSITDLTERRDKVYNILADMEDLEISQPDGTDKKEREKNYEDQRVEISGRYQDAFARAMEAYAALDAPADQVATGAPQPVIAGGGQGNQVKIQSELKPFVLSKEHNPTEFNQWLSQFKAYFSASNMDKLSLSGQQAFFKRQLDSSLVSILDSKITSTTPVFDNANQPGQDSCFSPY